MTRIWAEYVRNFAESLGRYYPGGIESGDVHLWSLNLIRAGPTVAARLDLPDFTAHPRGDWVEAGCDRIQCRVDFLGVHNLALNAWNGAGNARLRVAPIAENRLKVLLEGDYMNLGFACSDSLVVSQCWRICCSSRTRVADVREPRGSLPPEQYPSRGE
jgi:hypothetical protein